MADLVLGLPASDRNNTRSTGHSRPMKQSFNTGDQALNLRGIATRKCIGRYHTCIPVILLGSHYVGAAKDFVFPE